MRYVYSQGFDSFPLVFTWSFLPLPGSEFRSPIISQNCFSSPPTWPFYSTLHQQPTYLISQQERELARMCQWVGWRLINYIFKSLNRFASFDGSMHPSEVQHSQWWVPNSTLPAKTSTDEKGKEIYTYQCMCCQNSPLKIRLVFCSTEFPFQTFMWNIQSPENISSEHICVFALLMMFRQKFWDQGHTSGVTHGQLSTKKILGSNLN